MNEPKPVKVGSVVHFGAFGPFGCPCVPAIVLHVFSPMSVTLLPLGTPSGLGSVHGSVLGVAPTGPPFQSAMHGSAQANWHFPEECVH